MNTRHLIVVDVETNGLDPARHIAVEVAWWNLTTDEAGCFIPAHTVSDALARADIRALQLNRYIDRIAELSQDDGTEAVRLWQQFGGDTESGRVALSNRAVLAGSNPAFDAAFLPLVFRAARTVADIAERPWHHRMWDLSAYAAGVLGLDELPGLAKVCELLDVEPGDHSATADVMATGLCFRKLMAKAGAR